jgi:O-antigen ligase
MHDQNKTYITESVRPGQTASDIVGLLRKLLGIVFGAFLLASAVSIAASQILLGVCVLLFASIMIRQRDGSSFALLKPLLLVWFAYFLWLLVASVANDNVWRSLNCIREEWLLVILPIGLYLARERAVSRRLLLTLAIAIALISAYGIFQHFLGWRLMADQHLHKVGGTFRLSGNFSHPLTYGYYVVTATIFYLALSLGAFRRMDRLSRYLIGGAAVLGLLASALCNSRGPMLALLIGLVFVGLVAGRLRWAVIGLATVALVVAALSPNLMAAFSKRVANDWQADNPAGRLFIWNHAGAVALDNPLFGCGPGNFGEAFAAQLPPEFAHSGSKGHAHNDFIHQAAVAGFPAMILFAAFWGVACRRFWKLRVDPQSTPSQKALAFAGLAATVAFLAGSMTECAFADEELRQLILALWVFAWNPADEAAGAAQNTGSN